METKETYNGWTNYATWRIALELFDGYEFEADYITPDYLIELAEEWSTDNCENEITKDYALAFLAQVNYYEIAEHLNEMNSYEANL